MDNPLGQKDFMTTASGQFIPVPPGRETKRIIRVSRDALVAAELEVAMHTNPAVAWTLEELSVRGVRYRDLAVVVGVVISETGNGFEIVVRKLRLKCDYYYRLSTRISGISYLKPIPTRANWFAQRVYFFSEWTNGPSQPGNSDAGQNLTRIQAAVTRFCSTEAPLLVRQSLKANRPMTVAGQNKNGLEIQPKAEAQEDVVLMTTISAITADPAPVPAPASDAPSFPSLTPALTASASAFATGSPAFRSAVSALTASNPTWTTPAIGPSARPSTASAIVPRSFSTRPISAERLASRADYKMGKHRANLTKVFDSSTAFSDLDATQALSVSCALT